MMATKAQALGQMAQRTWKLFIEAECFDHHLFRNLKIDRVDVALPGNSANSDDSSRVQKKNNPKVFCSMTVEKYHLNKIGTLHGGVISSLVDIAGSLAVAVARQSPFTGVSTDINVSYLRAAKLGETISITGECQRLGRNLAYTTVDLFNQNGELLAAGRHTKYIGNSPPANTAGSSSGNAAPDKIPKASL